MTSEKTLPATRVKSIVRLHGSQRIAAFREYDRKHCVSDSRMRRIILRRVGPVKFDRVRFRAGSVVKSSYLGKQALWLVVGHGYTGANSNERGCFGCKITDRVHKKWQWIGPESMIRRA
jgi:hypothetical protein